jgi:serine protease Do
MGKMLTLDVKVGEWVMDKKVASGSAPNGTMPSSASANALGARVIDLNQAQIRQLGVSGGVLVEAVSDAAAHDGLRIGDVIVGVGNTAITSAAQFDAIGVGLPAGKQVAVLVRRGDAGIYVLLRPQKQ